MRKGTSKRNLATGALAFAMTASLLLGNVATQVASAETVPAYSVTKNDWKAIGFTKTRSTFKFPERYKKGNKKGMVIEAIHTRAFANCKKLKKVILSKHIDTIGTRAFVNCKNLKTVKFLIEDGELQWIGAYAFSNCSSLKMIDIPEATGGVLEGAFKGCTSLESVTLPESNPYIGDYTFYKCSKLKEIELPNDTEYVGEYAFAKCTSLKEIDIPDGTTEIRASAFSGCTKLKNITIPSSVTDIGEAAFKGCKGTIVCEMLEEDAEGTFDEDWLKGFKGEVVYDDPDEVEDSDSDESEYDDDDDDKSEYDDDDDESEYDDDDDESEYDDDDDESEYDDDGNASGNKEDLLYEEYDEYDRIIKVGRGDVIYEVNYKKLCDPVLCDKLIALGFTDEWIEDLKKTWL